jgi:hypothetical protein
VATIEEALRRLDALSPALKQRFEALCGDKPEAIEEAIALWKASDRIMLAAAGIITTTDPDQRERAGQLADFSLTSVGRKLATKALVH